MTVCRQLHFPPEVLGIQVRLYLNMSISYLHVIYSGRKAIFHQPGFSERSGCFLTELPFASDVVPIDQPISLGTSLAGKVSAGNSRKATRELQPRHRQNMFFRITVLHGT